MSARVAGIADYAALDFKAETSIVADALPTPATWREQAPSDLMVLRIAAAILQKSPAEMQEATSGAGVDAMMDAVDSFGELHDRYEAYAAVAEAARIRSLAGLSRVILEETNPNDKSKP